MKKLIFTLSMAVLACSCQSGTQQNNQNPPPRNEMRDDQNRQQCAPKRSGCGSCESEKPQAPAAQQSQTAATPEVKVEKAQ